MNVNRNGIELQDIAKNVRLKILDMSYKSGKGHRGGSFSCVEILVALYCGGILNYNPLLPKWEGRDRFILSKGHAAQALYAVLNEVGMIQDWELNTYCQNGSRLESHPNINIPGVEVNTGSLGNGLGIGVGMALANRSSRVFVLMGDGECHEGSVWEAAMLATQLNLNNLIAIIDANGFCASGDITKINGIEPLKDKWQAFGWGVTEIVGHDFDSIIWALSNPKYPEYPNIIIARTVKGKGVSFMENNASWHQRMPTKEEYELARNELDGLT